MLDKKYTSKPDKTEIGRISNYITDEIKEFDIETFAREAGENGKPFTPALFNGKRKKENFKQQEIYALDFDNGVTIDEFLARAEKYCLLPAFVYATFSDSEEQQRFRAVFINDCTATDEKAASIILEFLLNIFPEADQCCGDVSRLFLGGKKLLYINTDAKINIKDLVVSVQEMVMEKNSHNYARSIQKIGQKLSIAVKNGILCIHRYSDVENNEEIRLNTSIIMGNIQNSSKSYIIETPHKHPVSIRPNEELRVIQNKSYQDIAKICPLFQDFYEYDLPHEQKFCLATNLLYVKGGKQLFFDGLKENHDRWKIQWKYMKACEYKPQSCWNIDCPHKEKCMCKTLYEKLTNKMKRIKGEDTFISLEDATEGLYEALGNALIEKRNDIYLIKAQTAIGKTTAYCSMAEQWEGEKPLMIVVPTIKLQFQVYERLQKCGVEAHSTPNIDELLKGLNLCCIQQEITELYRKGFGYRVKRTIKEYLEENRERLDKYEQDALENYLKAAQELDGSECVVTTHAMLLALPEKVLKRYEIIIDEDILMTVFKNTKSISFQDIETSLQNRIFSIDIENRMSEIIRMEDGSTGYTSLEELDKNQLEQLYEKKMPIRSAISEFIASATFHVDVQEEQVYYFCAKKIPNIKLTIVSASVNEKLYRDYCQGRNVHCRDIPLVKYKGKLLQYVTHSMSRSCIQNIGLERVQKSIQRITGNQEAEMITFRKFSGEKNIYFGKTEGFNDYEGKNLFVLGTPHNIPFIYRLVGKQLNYDVDGNMSVSTAENNGYSFPIMTFQNKNMRNLQFYFLESELEQAIGRARLLRFPCTVYLFSNFPCCQAEIIQDDYVIGNDDKEVF